MMNDDKINDPNVETSSSGKDVDLPGKSALKSVSLEENFQNARRLIEFNSKIGRETKPEIIETVFRSEEEHANGDWDPAKEKDFWVSFAALTKFSQPATIDSINATAQLQVHRFWPWEKRQEISKVDLMRNRFRRWAIFALAFLLIFQIYWVVGAAAINTIEDIDKKIIILQEKKKKDEIKDPEYTQKLGNLGNRKIAQYEIMVDLFLGIFQKPSNIKTELKYAVIQDSFRSMLSVISIYILPLLYGWLGAASYILREFSRIQREAYIPSDINSRYSLRMYLGAIAGLSIGWIFTPLNTTTLGSLSPLALAFIAGYSVELIFSAMDRLVEAYTKPEKSA